mgnify:CR=1 FL=1
MRIVLVVTNVLKFVVGSMEDLVSVKNIMETLRAKGCRCSFYLSPVFGSIEPVDIVNFMIFIKNTRPIESSEKMW